MSSDDLRRPRILKLAGGQSSTHMPLMHSLLISATLLAMSGAPNEAPCQSAQLAAFVEKVGTEPRQPFGGLPENYPLEDLPLSAFPVSGTVNTHVVLNSAGDATIDAPLWLYRPAAAGIVEPSNVSGPATKAIVLARAAFERDYPHPTLEEALAARRELVLGMIAPESPLT